MSISASAISELAFSQVSFPQLLQPDPVLYAFNPQDVDYLLPQTLSADPAAFAFLPQAASTNFPVAPRQVLVFDIPDFDIPSAWTIPLYGPLIIFAGYTPAFKAFIVRMVDGNFALWVGLSQGVMLGLQRATDRALFLKNLGPPFLSSFLP
jgi:hypothetical protein